MLKTIGKIMAIGALVAFGSAAQACPKLEGSYNCQYKDYPIDVTVIEKPGRGFTSYDINYGLGRVVIHPDGKEHTLEKLPPLDSKAKNFKYTATCKGSEVPFNGTADMKDGSGKATLTGRLIRNAKNVGISFVLTSAKDKYDVTMTCDPL